MKNIAIVNTKGGVGKSTLSFHLLPFFLKGKNFEIVEIDDNNDTSLSFVNSEILANKITSCDIAAGTDKLEELVVENMLEEDKITIIDGGGGNDSKIIIESLIKQNLAKDTLFIIPYFADFAQIKNVFETVNLVSDYNFIVVLNSFINSKEDLMFVNGDEEFEIPNFAKNFAKNFFLVKKTNLFSYSGSILKKTILDFAMDAFNFNQDQILEHAKTATNANKDEMLQIYKNWKISKMAKEYLEDEEITKLKKAISSHFTAA